MRNTIRHFWRKIERKNTEEEEKRKKKYRVRDRPCVELSPSPSLYIGPQRVHVSRALCIIVLRSRGCDLSVNKRHAMHAEAMTFHKGSLIIFRTFVKTLG